MILLHGYYNNDGDNATCQNYYQANLLQVRKISVEEDGNSDTDP